MNQERGQVIYGLATKKPQAVDERDRTALRAAVTDTGRLVGSDQGLLRLPKLSRHAVPYFRRSRLPPVMIQHRVPEMALIVAWEMPTIRG
jgi:hypothetical protein